MQPLDLFIAAVSATFGLVLIIGAILDAPWLTSLPKSRRLADAIGKPAARFVIALVGIGLVALGLTIASGWRMNWG